MASLGGLFGSESIGGQFLLWNVGSELVGGLLAPVIQGLQNETWALAVGAAGGGLYVPLSPADLARMVVRNIVPADEAASTAAMSGVRPQDMTLLIDSYGNSLGPQELAVALRRGLIPETGTGPDAISFQQGIAEGDLKDKWADTVKDLAVEWPTPNDALDALLEGQTDQGTAQALYQKFGGDPDYFTLLFNTRGNAPTPEEALTMANRGIIPWSGTGPDVVSYEQAFLEGPWRNKWLQPFEQLGVYLPPPRTVTTLLNHGVLTDAQALVIYKQTGLSDELAAAYVASATSEKLASAKTLTQATVEKLYLDKLITADQATTMLGNLGFTPEEITFLLESIDFARAAAAFNSAVSRIGTLYVGHKLSRAGAVDSLQKLDVPAETVTHLLATWDAELAANVKTLTPAQIALAYSYGVKDAAWCIGKLQEEGYDAHDAWVLIGVENKGPIPATDYPEPAEGVAAGMERSVTE